MEVGPPVKEPHVRSLTENREASQPWHSWLLENASIPSSLISDLLADNPELATLLKGRTLAALCWLVTTATKCVYTAFAGWSFAAADFTPIRLMTVGALARLPGVAPDARLIVRQIRTVGELPRKIDETVYAAHNGDLLVFVGDVAGELDGHDFAAMRAMGSVKLPVELTAGGWPICWRPFDLDTISN
jgi:hypothetical protein